MWLWYLCQNEECKYEWRESHDDDGVLIDDVKECPKCGQEADLDL